MIREGIARAALHAFPRAVRDARGQEMLGTLLDASTPSRRRFVREIVDVVRSGLCARAQRDAEEGAARLIADGFCLAAVWLLTLFLSSDLADRIRGPLPGFPWHPFTPWSLALLATALALALSGYDRLAGVAALLFIGSILGDAHNYGLTNGDAAALAVPALCFGALLLLPRRRTPDLRRLAWLAVTAALAVGASGSEDTTAAILLFALVFLVGPALALVTTNPRPLIACALVATYLGTRIAQDPGGPGPIGLVFLAAAPLVITVAFARTRHAQKRAAI